MANEIYSLKDIPTLTIGIANNTLSPNVLIKSFITEPLLVCAIEARQKDLINLLIEKGADVNFSFNEGRTPFLSSIVEKREDLTDLFLSMGADINLVSNSYPSTPLMACAFINNKKLCSRLLNLGAKPELDAGHFGNKPFTALYLAIRENNAQMCQMLIDSYPKDYPIVERMEKFEAMLGNNETLPNRHLAIDYIKSKIEKESIGECILKAENSKSVKVKI